MDGGAAEVPDNGAVVILDRGDLTGDVAVEGNRAVIYGESPAEVVIDGSLDLRGNESLVRGVTVAGDVTFEGNAAELYFCVVYGDVVLKGNGNFISNCTIFGSVRGSGNEDRLVSNTLLGSIELSGPASECRDNLRFDDGNGNRALDTAEVDAATPLSCD